MLKSDLYSIQRRRRFTVFLLLILTAIILLLPHNSSSPGLEAEPIASSTLSDRIENGEYVLATKALGELAIRERMDNSGYARSNFSSGWGKVEGCDMRNRILQRDLSDVVLDDDSCTVLGGTLEKDQFSGKRIEFERGPETSYAVHIEHIVAVSDAWQKGAQKLSQAERYEFYNDPLNLIAIDGPTNMEKGSKDASDWLPRPAYRCRYVARQIAIKKRYDLWVSQTEHNAMTQELQACPEQVLPVQGVD